MIISDLGIYLKIYKILIFISYYYIVNHYIKIKLQIVDYKEKYIENNGFNLSKYLLLSSKEDINKDALLNIIIFYKK